MSRHLTKLGAVIVLLSGCHRPNPCNCPAVIDPVCGADGIDYTNACAAACAGVSIRHAGFCTANGPSSCTCPAVSDPVCGADGHTYDNACQASCAATMIAQAGACETVDAGGNCGGPTPIDCNVPMGCSAAVVCQNGIPQCAITCPDGGTDEVRCTGLDQTFPTFNRACTSVSDCGIAFHQVSCCGSRTAIGITATEQARFNTDEAVCESQYPACGCAEGPTMVDDGSSAPSEDAISVACVDMQCKTYVQACPATQPTSGTPCTPAQLTCSYMNGNHCSCEASSGGTQWSC